MLAPFDIAKEPLTAGTTLIEASAGTGKTTAIASLFLRLVVEEDVAVSEILVTTYTKPATAELRQRIRSLLRAALDVFCGREKGDPFLADLLAAQGNNVARARQRVESALRNFDEAAIYTIHGFCQRMLQDRAFESGLPFAAELISDQSAIVREIADDFWRTQFYERDPFLTVVALAGEVTPAALAKLLADFMNKPLIEVIPAPGGLPDMQRELSSLFAQLRACWEADAQKITGYFASNWASGTFVQGKPASVQSALRAMTACFSQPGAPLDAFKQFDFFAQDRISRAARKGASAPCHEFFGLCQRLPDLREAFVLALKSDFLAWARDELGQRKLQRNVLSFDDLLTRLHAALNGPSGGTLAKLIQSRFRAALIDEFQDTDALQEAIFRRLFHGRKDGWLYLIGDPKQAIYGFRGADVFTYLAAAHRAQLGFTLDTNRRSESGLVRAINQLFGRSDEVFALPGISFRPVHSDRARDQSPLTIDGRQMPPFRIWWWDSPEPIKSQDAHEHLPRVTAAAIARMLANDVRIGPRRVEPRDFAVLTWSNLQAQSIQAALGELGVPAVLHGTASVFQSREAGELYSILAAIAQPTRNDFLRAALATDLLGHSAVDLEALGRDEHRWEATLLRFQAHHETWGRVGFIQMFRRFLSAEGVRLRLLAWRDGERRLTNVLHLAELLHCAASERRLGITALVKWLGEHRDAESLTVEEYELRLESDEQAVQVVTMHKSKGLEYPIVFVPFSWSNVELREDESVVFHPVDAAGQLTLDLGSRAIEEHAALALRERLAEQVRLLYVALTRARHQCTLVWGRFNKHETSAAAWMLHPPPASVEDRLATFLENGPQLSSAQMRADLEGLAGASAGAIAIDPLPRDEAPRHQGARLADAELAPRVFRGHVERDWRIASFSSLTAGRDAEQPDFDRIDAPLPLEEEVSATGIHGFPRGLKAGVCIHEILEEADFRAPAIINEIVARKLSIFGFDTADFRDAVTACVHAVVQLPLAPGLSLNRVSPAARLNEMEFYLPMSRLEATELTRLFGELPTSVGRLQFEPQHGYLKGFIDLVFEHDGKFYIVDWKSNWLGPQLSAYTDEAIRAEMRRHHYLLQSHLYVVALHRYLTLRLPGYSYEEDFGGVFYRFLRGADFSDPGRGVFADRPSASLIEKLAALFASEKSP